MKKVWAVIYTNKIQSIVSSECYVSLDDAIKFVKSRGGVEKIDNSLTFITEDNNSFYIKELKVKEDK